MKEKIRNNDPEIHGKYTSNRSFRYMRVSFTNSTLAPRVP